jgi:hypothetical protein
MALSRGEDQKTHGKSAIFAVFCFTSSDPSRMIDIDYGARSGE